MLDNVESGLDIQSGEEQGGPVLFYSQGDLLPYQRRSTISCVSLLHEYAFLAVMCKCKFGFKTFLWYHIIIQVWNNFLTKQ